MNAQRLIEIATELEELSSEGGPVQFALWGAELRSLVAALGPLLRQAWDDGIATAKNYGDNVHHLHGEQADRKFNRFLSTLAPAAPLVSPPGERTPTRCESRSPNDGFPCTLEKGHTGPHTALGVPPVEAPPSAPPPAACWACDVESASGLSYGRSKHTCHAPEATVETCRAQTRVWNNWVTRCPRQRGHDGPHIPGCFAWAAEAPAETPRETFTEKPCAACEILSLRQQLAQAQQERDEALRSSGRWERQADQLMLAKRHFEERAREAESRLSALTQERDAIKAASAEQA